MSKSKSSLENYVLFLDFVLKMRNTPFKPQNFLKQIRPFCKTTHLKNQILFIRIRGSNIGLSIYIEKDFFQITQSQSVHQFIFYCETKTTSSKYLLLKLVKHNLLTP